MTQVLPQFLRDLLASPPRAGTGMHGWLFRCARQLHAHRSQEEIFRLLEAASHGCGRHVPAREIKVAIANSVSCAWRPDEKYTAQPVKKWPDVNQEQRAAIIRDNGGLADLWECSPIKFEGDHHTEEIVDQLFPSNPLLCCGSASWSFATKPRDEWRGQLAGLQLVVPSPMKAVSGLTQEGKESEHCLNNTGPRRFLVCEFDKGTADEHAALLMHLGCYALLVLAVHSGGKSLHGWFYVAGQPEEKVLKFFRYAVSLGADDATWTRSQFVRMPDGTRDNGKHQSVYFFNPNFGGSK